jgi:hypothetical protein
MLVKGNTETIRAIEMSFFAAFGGEVGGEGEGTSRSGKGVPPSAHPLSHDF